MKGRVIHLVLLMTILVNEGRICGNCQLLRNGLIKGTSIPLRISIAKLNVLNGRLNTYDNR